MDQMVPVSLCLCGNAVSSPSLKVISHLHVLGEEIEAESNGVTLTLLL